MRDPARWLALLAAVWLGGLLCVATIATPAAFAVLGSSEGGRVAGRILSSEAAASIILGAVMLVLHRLKSRAAAEEGATAPVIDTPFVLAAGAVFCTLAGFYALQPMMADARTGRGSLSFAQLHAISVAFFGLKLLLVAWLSVHLILRISQRPTS